MEASQTGSPQVRRETPFTSSTDVSAARPLLPWREWLAILLLIVLSDLTIYRGAGFAGYGLLFFTAPWLLLLGATRPRGSLSRWLVHLMLALLAARLAWCGSSTGLVMGVALLFAFAMSSRRCGFACFQQGSTIPATLTRAPPG